MQTRRSHLFHGCQSPSKAVRPDDRRVKTLLLNLSGIVGLLFLGLALLHLTYGMGTSHTFHAYIAIFLVLEGLFITVRFCIFFGTRSGPPSRHDDEEACIIAVTKGSPGPPSPFWRGSSVQCESPPLHWISKSTEDTKRQKSVGVNQKITDKN